MVHNQKTFIILAFSILFVGCSKTQNSIQPLPTDSRVELRSGPIGLSANSSGFTPQSYSGPLIGGDPVEFEYVAQITPPLHPTLGRRVQATAMKRIDHNRVAVVYNMQGGDLGGAVDIIQLSNPSNPLIKSSTFFNGREFSDFVIKDDVLYISGNDIDGAIIQMLDVHNVNHPTDLGVVQLVGNTATSIAIHDDSLFVTTAEGGGMQILNIPNSGNPVLLSSNPLTRASHVLLHDDIPVVTAGDGTKALFTWTGSVFNGLAELPDVISESPARSFDQGAFLITNAANGFVSIFDYDNYPGGLGLVENKTVPGRGNGLYSSLFVSLLAQGDGGLIWADHRGVMAPAPVYPTAPAGASNPSAPTAETLLRGSFDFPNDPGSANNVLLYDPNEDGEDIHILIADGLGGLRWIKEVERTLFRSTKSYGPTTFYPDVKFFFTQKSFEIPEKLNVVAGNAGNHWARIEFDDVVCFYKGGSSQAHPSPGNPSQWNAGLKYNFHSCSNGMDHGDSLFVQYKVEFTVLNGSSNAGTTTVEANLH